MSTKYDLEDRTFTFAQRVRFLLRRIPKQSELFEDCDQLRRSAGSVGANYIEVNEAMSRKDFAHRIKICRKEAKESKYWLKLLETSMPQEISKEWRELIQEAHELQLIFGSIIQKLEHS